LDKGRHDRGQFVDGELRCSSATGSEGDDPAAGGRGGVGLCIRFPSIASSDLVVLAHDLEFFVVERTRFVPDFVDDTDLSDVM